MEKEWKENDIVRTRVLTCERLGSPVIETFNFGYILKITGFEQALCKMIAPDKTTFEKVYRFEELFTKNIQT